MLKMRYLVLAAVAVATAIGCGQPTSSEQNDDSSAPVAPADNTTTSSRPKAPDFTVTMLDGSTVHLNDFAGKPLVIHFWATWCGPCRKELPVLDKMFLSYQPKGVQFLLIAVNDQRETVVKYLKQGGFHFTSALDPRGTSLREYKSRYVPTTVLVDDAGNIAEKQIGSANERKWAEIMEKLVGQP